MDRSSQQIKYFARRPFEPKWNRSPSFYLSCGGYRIVYWVFQAHGPVYESAGYGDWPPVIAQRIPIFLSGSFQSKGLLRNELRFDWLTMLYRECSIIVAANVNRVKVCSCGLARQGPSFIHGVGRGEMDGRRSEAFPEKDISYNQLLLQRPIYHGR